ncbi:MAG TPA: flagellar basal body rod protein FlgC [Bacillota bacterium]|nr:flagellar basal body rod protein FlgC [Bacillota bacterium]HOL09115.1 flagellar basal body rod protein FlgC [Bacillota bacterium]HPO97172.1 flagellar basal body rod protein FlgC [Bacillota bacterium]
MNLFRNFDISASALTAERLRMDLISNNIANARTTRTEEGGPYRRQVPIFATVLEDKINAAGQVVRNYAGVKVVGIRNDNRPPQIVYDPSHPDANEAGYVAYPDINVVTEMVDLIGASRAYEANITAFNAAKDMFRAALELGRA